MQEVYLEKNRCRRGNREGVCLYPSTCIAASRLLGPLPFRPFSSFQFTTHTQSVYFPPLYGIVTRATAMTAALGTF